MGNKHTLKAAKDVINKQFKKEIEELHDVYCKVCEEESNSSVEDMDKAYVAYTKKCAEYEAWKAPKKKKRAKSIEWSGEYDASERPAVKARKKITDSDALQRVQRKVIKSSSPRASSSWLQEGCLVVKRGQTKPMIVLSINTNGSVEVLNDGNVEWHRDLSLRPTDFEN
tara:strand:- start:29 stop:535 length:507 start_codon:yes stop_codon:yes gene_type:complete